MRSVWVFYAVLQAAICSRVLGTAFGGGGASTPVGCLCSGEYDAVCGRGYMTYRNKCVAACAMGSNGTWTPGSCDYVPGPFGRCDGDRVACKGDPCNVSFRTCAGARSALTCEAVRCDNVVLSNGTKIPACSAVWYDTNGAMSVCPTALAVLPAECLCPAVMAPVCTTANKTFINACEATCQGYTVSYVGECQGNVSIASPSPSGSGGNTDGGTKCDCITDYRPVCGQNSQTFDNSCEAACVGVPVAYSGVCVRRSPSPALPATPPSPVPPATPPSPVPPATPPSPVPPATPPSPVPPATPPSPMSPFGPTAPADPEAPLHPSSPAPSTSPAPLTPTDQMPPSNVVSANPPNVTSCLDCTLDYSPVCGADMKTYPNKCSADCTGKTVRKIGKCFHCTGEQCTHGKKSDLCILGSEQCWSVKYECRPILGSKDTFLGSCQLKPFPPPSPPKPPPSPRHRRRSLRSFDHLP